MLPRLRSLPVRPRRRVMTPLATGMAAALVLAGCGDDVPDGAGDTDSELEIEGDEDPGSADDLDVEAPADEAPADGAPDDDAAQDDASDEQVEPLAGEPSTEEVSQDPEGHGLTVTDVRASTHDGFDRIVFELDGDEAAGYDIGYTRDGEASSQGSGEPIEVAGEATLGIALHGIALPADADDGTTAWDADHVDGPDGGVVLEVVEDTIFEGIHTFFAGSAEELPFLVERLDDPQRVVVDVHHD
jgi:hypothetical protein